MDAAGTNRQDSGTARQKSLTGLLTPGRMRLGAGLLAASVLLVLAGVFLADRSAYISTADARVATTMIGLSGEVSGQITSVSVREGDRVQAGDVLYTLDDREAFYTLAGIEAEVQRIRLEMERAARRSGLATSKAGSQVEARRAVAVSAGATVEAARSEMETARRDYERTNDLFQRGLVPQSALDQARNTLDTASQSLARALADREGAVANQRTASIEGKEAELADYDLGILAAALQNAEARLAAQKVVLGHYVIRSPIDGVVDELFFDPGEHALQGFRMALLHDPEDIWISANIKETDIRHIHPGAEAMIRADSHPSVTIRGRVVHVHDATVSEAAMMPNPNAAGVFTKITQRISVRVEMTGERPDLKPGTMVSVRIRKGKPASVPQGAPA